MGKSLSKAIIFDFDGTLVNSEKLIRKTFIDITRKIAPNRLSIAKKVLIGPTLKDTVKEILGGQREKFFNKFVEDFISIHDNEILAHTSLYNNSNETLSILFQMGYKMAIATNKREGPTKKLIKHYNWGGYFKFLECSDNNALMRNKSQMIANIISSDKDFKDSFYVGDTTGDYKAADFNNLRFIKAKYGYGKMQNWDSIKSHKEIESIGELVSILS